MASYLLLGLVSTEDNEKHLAILSNCEKRADFVEAVKEAVSGKVADELLCVQGSILPLKVSGNRIESIAIGATEYPLTDASVAKYTDTPVYIKGDNNA